MSKRIVDWERIEAEYRAGACCPSARSRPRRVSTPPSTNAPGRGLDARSVTAASRPRPKSWISKREVSAQGFHGEGGNRPDHRRGDGRGDRQHHPAGAPAGHQEGPRPGHVLLDELEEQTGNIDLFRELGLLLRSEDDKAKDRQLNDIYHKVIAMPGRVDSMKKLADSMKVLIGLEREAYGLTADAAGAQDDAPTGLDHFMEQADARPTLNPALKSFWLTQRATASCTVAVPPRNPGTPPASPPSWRPTQCCAPLRPPVPEPDRGIGLHPAQAAD